MWDKKKNKTVKGAKPAAKPSKSLKQVKNWYADRYLSIALQRNFLFIFASVSSVGILVALVVIKNLYEQRSLDPYLIEVEKQTNMLTIVEHKSKDVYTAQEAIKNFFIRKYIKAQEEYHIGVKEADMVRISSSPEIYDNYTKNTESLKVDLRKVGRGAEADIKILSLSHLTSPNANNGVNRVEITFLKNIVSTDEKRQATKKFVVTMTYNWAKLELSQERMINPLGFYITSYSRREIYELNDNEGEK